MPNHPSSPFQRPSHSRNAGFQPAVSQVCNLQTATLFRILKAPTLAHWKSAIPQVTNLRYSGAKTSPEMRPTPRLSTQQQ